MNSYRYAVLPAAVLALGLALGTGSQQAQAGACKQISDVPNKQCVKNGDVKKGAVKENRLHQEVQDQFQALRDHTSERVPFYVTLDTNQASEVIATHGPLKYIVRCEIDNSSSEDRVEIVATSDEGPWWEEKSASTERSAFEDRVAMSEAHPTGGKAFDNDEGEHSMIGPGGYVMAIGGDAVGIGLNLYGHPCTAAGNVYKMKLDNPAP